MVSGLAPRCFAGMTAMFHQGDDVSTWQRQTRVADDRVAQRKSFQIGQL